MRLIDADKLKFKNVAEVNGILTHILTAEEIDNAPTVNPDVPIFSEIWYQERPQGEWIKHSTYKDVLICSKCNHGSNQVYETFNFCPNCGAQMVKGGDPDE